MAFDRRNMLKTGMYGGGAVLFGAGYAARRLTGERVARVGAEVIGPRMLGVLASETKPVSPPTEPFQVPLPIPAVLKPASADATTDFLELHAQEALVHIPGLPSRLMTPVWGFNGGYLGPTIKARGRLGQPDGLNPNGRKTVLRMINTLRASITIHRHGGYQAPIDDGHPLNAILPGTFQDYRWGNDQEGITMWYHDHSLDRTGEQVYAGLAGMFLLSDEIEDDLKARKLLPSDEHDIPLILQDKSFAADGRFNFPPPPDVTFVGLEGDKMMVNGAIQPFLQVANRLYRFRFLNASTARNYQLALSNGRPLIQIGSDGALLPKPVSFSTLRIAPAERIEVLIDFSQVPVGGSVMLVNHGGSSKNLQLGDLPAEIMRFDVVRNERDDIRLPDTLRDIPRLLPASAARERTFVFERNGNNWTINGLTYDENRVDATLHSGDVEIWNLVNLGGGWIHPVHIHMIELQVLGRQGHPDPAPSAETGLKDTFLLRENETVRIIGRFLAGNGPIFSPGAGHPMGERTFVFHCHNLEHEDHDMMAQFEATEALPRHGMLNVEVVH